jgi:nucleosome binding factor SPN SPT16 subunit
VLNYNCDYEAILTLSSARILEQLQKHRSVVPVEIFTLAKSKEPPTDALPRFLSVFTSNQRIGTLSKETYAGKLIDEWNNALAASNNKPEMTDIAASISTFMGVKDDEELASRVFYIRSALNSCHAESDKDGSKPDRHVVDTLRCSQAGNHTRPGDQNIS